MLETIGPTTAATVGPIPTSIKEAYTYRDRGKFPVTWESDLRKV
jgi:hypothetical protein